MTDTHQISFEANGVTVEASYTQRAKSGLLRVWLDGRSIVDLDWCDYDPAYFTDAGLEQRARTEIADLLEYQREPTNFGEDETPDADVTALLARVVA